MRPLADIAAELSTISTGLQRIADELREPPTSGYTVVSPGLPIQPALDAALPGHEIRLISGARYPGNIRIAKPVTIRGMNLDGLGDQRVTPAAAGAMATIVPTTGAPLIDILPGVVDVNLLRFACDPQNLNDVITVGHADSSQTSVDRQPQRIALRQLLIAATDLQTPKRGVGIHGRQVLVEGCHISGIKRVGQDSQAVCGWNGEGVWSIRDCFLEAAGETVMIGGSTPAIPNLIPSIVAINGCTLTKNLAWRGGSYTIKNLLEIKAGRSIALRDSQLSNCWHPSQNGYAVMLTPVMANNPGVIVEDVTVERNEITNVGAGVNLLGHSQEGPSLQTRGIVLRDNWWQINRALGVQAWYLFMSGAPRDITIDHETIESTSTNAILKHEGAPVEGFAFTGNLVPRCGEYGFSGWTGSTVEHFATRVGVYLPGATIAGNAFGSFPRPANLPSNTHVASAVITLEDGYGSGSFADYGRRRAA